MICARTERDIVDAVHDARGRRFEIVSGGSKRVYGRPMSCDVGLNVSGLNGVVNYEPEELVLTVRPGTKITEITSLLEEKHQRLGFDPADWGPLLGAKPGAATIGGALSADTNGPSSVRYGRARDALLGFRAVNGWGEAYKAGGKVVKNVTGFDLPKLICGAMGTLGVLTEVTLRVFPRPPRSAVLSVRDLTPEDGLALLRRVWQSPLEATGLSYIPASAPLPELGYVGEGAALIRLDGASEPLKEKVAALRSVAPAVQEIDVPDVFSTIANGVLFIGQDCDVWRVSVPPSKAATVIREIQSPSFVADNAGGILWIGREAGGNGADLRSLCEKLGGHATLVRASEDTRLRVAPFTPEGPARHALTKSVKAAFDPRGLFNPGRMWKTV